VVEEASGSESFCSRAWLLSQVSVRSRGGPEPAASSNVARYLFGLYPEGTIQISSVDGATGLTRPAGLVTLSATADGKGPASIGVTGILQ
jgi:hypothetical protein